MISCDTNILFPAMDSDSSLHDKARTWLADHGRREDFCLCEQVLMELYCLLRNPTVCSKPLAAPEAVRAIDRLRGNPHWRIVDVVAGSDIMKTVWDRAGRHNFAYGRIFDLRLAMTLRHHGVTDFATRNARDFADCGFRRVWNPLT